MRSEIPDFTAERKDVPHQRRGRCSEVQTDDDVDWSDQTGNKALLSHGMVMTVERLSASQDGLRSMECVGWRSSAPLLEMGVRRANRDFTTRTAVSVIHVGRR
jgi:hypothetical protein